MKVITSKGRAKGVRVGEQKKVGVSSSKIVPGFKGGSAPKADPSKKAQKPFQAVKQQVAFSNPTSVMKGKGDCRFVA